MPPKAQPKTEPELAESYRIFGLQVDSFMRLKTASVQFAPDGHVAVVSGDNDQGKTSLLNAIWTALGGPKVAPDDPVHGDAKKAEIVLDLVPTDDPSFDSPKRIRVCRTVDANGKWSLKLYADGRVNPFRSPQALLDEFFNALAFDPSEFLRMKPDKQAEIMVRLGGVEEKVAQLRAKRDALYTERTAKNTLAKNAQAVLDRLPAPRPGGNTEEISATEALQKLDAARETIRANQAKRDDLQDLYGDHNQLGIDIAAKEEELARVQQELQALKDEQEALQVKGRALKAEVAALVDPTVEDLDTRVNDLERLNKEAREARQYKAAKEQVSQHEQESDALSESIKEIDVKVRGVLMNSTLPVKGIEIQADGSVFYNGHPFAQASSARALEVSLAMGAAMHPRLRFLALKEASMMTETTRARVEAWAAEHGYFVLMELATTQRMGIHIVDGEVELAPTGEVEA